jgi:HSP20 family protein
MTQDTGSQGAQEGQEQHLVPLRNPFRDLWNFQQLFEHFDNEFFTRPLGVSRGEWFPRLDVRRKNGDILVEIELPGMTSKDVQIEVTEEGLSISGEKRQESETREENFYRSERSFGRFMRRIALPAGTDTDKAEARFEDGVLRITMPFKAAPQKRTIPVQSQEKRP